MAPERAFTLSRDRPLTIEWESIPRATTSAATISIEHPYGKTGAKMRGRISRASILQQFLRRFKA